MRYVIAAILVLCCVWSADCGSDYYCAGYDESGRFCVYVPCWCCGDYWWYCGDFDADIVQNNQGSMVLGGLFADNGDWKGFPFQFVRISGRAYVPFSDFQWYGCIGLATCWYENGWGRGLCTMPGGGLFWRDCHALRLNGFALDRQDIGQRWLQTQDPWGGDDYGNRGQSKIRKKGCCATCAAMQLASWGWDVNPRTLVAALRSYTDGFAGLSVNWLRLQKIYGCGFRRNVPIKEALLRGMTVQAGVKPKPNGEARHWVYSGGCQERNTRLLYPKSNWTWLLQGTGAGARPSGVTRGISQGSPGFDTDYVKQNLGKVALGKLITGYVGASGSSATTTAMPGPPALDGGSGDGSLSLTDEDALVDWGYSGYAAWAAAGNVHLALKQGSTVVAEEMGEALEDDETGEEGETEYVIEAPNLKGGNYTLEITGEPGTEFSVQTFEYDSFQESEPIDHLITGTIGESGTYEYAFSHNATAFINDLAGLADVPEGSTFVCYNGANMTAQGPTGQWVAQSDYRLVFPYLVTYTGTDTIEEFTRYRIQGMVGPNRTLTVDVVVLPEGATPGVVNCPPVFRNTAQAFDPAPKHTRFAITARGPEALLRPREAVEKAAALGPARRSRPCARDQCAAR